MKSECPTFLRSKGKTMVVTLIDDEVSDHESGKIRMETSLFSQLLL